MKSVLGTSVHARRATRIAGLPVAVLVVLVAMLFSILFGAADIRPDQVFAAIFSFNGSTEHLVIQTVRIPRAMVATSVGASLAVAGAIMQALTRNPLAAPGILGINAGAAFAVVAAVFFAKGASLSLYIWFAFLGAALAAGAVYSLGSLGRGGLTPLKLTVAGAALASFLASLTTAMLILSQRTLEEIRFWLAGSVAGRDLNLFLQVAPYIGIGLLISLTLGRALTALNLGEDVAKGVGQQTGLVKIISAIVVVILAGASVAIAGPIGFIGLVIPHFVRFVVGFDYRWILPYSALTGAAFLLVADLVGRLLIRPQEMPVGVMTALVGAPFFIYLARSRVKR